MHCRDAQFYLRLRRHAGDELGADVATELGRHLATCPACGAEGAGAAAFDRAVANTLRAVPVPTGLRDKLLAQASALRGAAIRHKAYRVAALAASLLVGVGLALGIFAGRPKLSGDSIVQINDDRSQQPSAVLEQWLAGLNAELPNGYHFDPELLVSAGKETLQGRDVPVAVFRSRPDPLNPAKPVEFARLYVLPSGGPFDTRDLASAGISHHVAEVVRDERRGTTYVIVYKNSPDGLKPFLAQRNGVPV